MTVARRHMLTVAVLILAAGPGSRSMTVGASAAQRPGPPGGGLPPAVGPGQSNARPLVCTVGRFRIAGAPLASTSDATESFVSLLGTSLSIDGVCPATNATLVAVPEGTRVMAQWQSCPALPRGAQLHAVIDGGTCANMEGTFQAPGAGASRSISGAAVRCDEFARRAGADPCEPLDRLTVLYKRWRTHLSARAYPVGTVPTGALTKAFADISVAPIAFDQWHSLGPAPVGQPTGNPPSGNSGRVDSIAIDPLAPNHWLIAASTGGIWETTDGGVTWHPRTDDQPSLATSAVAFAPGSPATAYAGTGHYSMAGGTGMPGIGLLKSQNGGQTWTRMAASTFAGLGFASIQVSGANADTFVAATTSGIEGFFGRYTSAGSASPGIYRSTTGGASATLTLPGQATDVVVDPGSFQRQYAALRSKTLWELTAEGLQFFPVNPNEQKELFGGGLFRSMDGGTKWSLINGPWSLPSAEIRVAIAPSNPDTLYVSVRKPVDVSAHLLGLWRSDNAWAPNPVWTAVPLTGLHPLGYPIGRPNHVISVHPTDPGTVYATGVRLWKFSGGAWTDISGQLIHPDQNALAWVGPRLVVGNDGGVFSRDETAGGAWSSHNTNLSITQFYAGATFPTDPSQIIAGAQDIGVVKKFQASTAWDLLYGGDGTSAQAGAQPGHWLYSLQHLGLVRTLNGGAVGASAADNIGDLQYAPFLSRVVRCPSNADIVLAGSKSLWRTNSFFSTPLAPTIPWAANGPALGAPGNPLQHFVSAIAFARSDASCKTYAFGGDKGPIHVTTDGGSSWTDLDPAQQVPDRYVTGLAFATNDADTLYVTLSGFNDSIPKHPGHVFKATGVTTGTLSWFDISPPADLPANVVVTHPTIPGTVYVGTDMGLWISHDGGASWAHAGPSTGLPNVPVMEIVPDACGVTVFTFGRGAFRNAVPFVCP